MVSGRSGPDRAGTTAAGRSERVVQQEADGVGTEGAGAPRGYERTPPTEVLINGKRCINTDAETFIALRAHYIANKVK